MSSCTLVYWSSFPKTEFVWRLWVATYWFLWICSLPFCSQGDHIAFHFSFSRLFFAREMTAFPIHTTWRKHASLIVAEKGNWRNARTVRTLSLNFDLAKVAKLRFAFDAVINDMSIMSLSKTENDFNWPNMRGRAEGRKTVFIALASDSPFLSIREPDTQVKLTHWIKYNPQGRAYLLWPTYSMVGQIVYWLGVRFQFWLAQRSGPAILVVQQHFFIHLGLGLVFHETSFLGQQSPLDQSVVVWQEALILLPGEANCVSCSLMLTRGFHELHRLSVVTWY